MSDRRRQRIGLAIMWLQVFLAVTYTWAALTVLNPVLLVTVPVLLGSAYINWRWWR
jgi:hypothetical protein